MYREKYGTLEGVCTRLSFADIGKISQNTMFLTDDVPSFVRLNDTFPDTKRGASVAWLFSHIKNLVVASGISPEGLANEQIDILADIIVGNYPSMKLTEFMLFESYFLGGRYQEFYGEASYIMAITKSLNLFRRDLNQIYAQIEREKQQEAQRETKPSVSWEEYCKMRGCEGKPLPGTTVPAAPIKVKTVVKKVGPLTEVEVGVRSAHAVIDNIYHFDKDGVATLRDAFRKRYKCWPEEYLDQHEETITES